MRLLLKILLPVLVVVLCVLAAKTVVANRPEPATRPQFKTSTAVDATRLAPQSYTVTLKTQGEVNSAIEGSLVARPTTHRLGHCWQRNRHALTRRPGTGKNSVAKASPRI